MSRIVIIGGHGKVALLAAPALVRDGHEVVSVVRRPGHVDEVAATGATPVVADVESLDVDELAAVLRGAEAVVWSAGAGGGSPRRTYAVDRDAAVRAMDAAVAAGVRQFVMVSYLGAGVDHGVPEGEPFFAYAEAKAAADAHLRATPLAWTILKPSRLTLEPSAGALDPAPTEGGATSRALVAEVIAAVVRAGCDAVGRTELAFTNGDVPVGEAIAGLRPRG